MRTKNWADINIAKLDDGCEILFTESIPNTNIKKGDIRKVWSYSVWNAICSVCMTFCNNGKTYDIPYGTFNVLKSKSIKSSNMKK